MSLIKGIPDVFIQATVGGFVGLWLFDVLTGKAVLHQAGATPGQTCVDCTASTTTPGSFDCTTCAATGTAGAPAFGCPTCTPSTTVPGTFDCIGCEGYTCDSCTADATGSTFTCTNCVDALTAVTTAAPVTAPPVATTPADPCASVTTSCVYVASVGGCARLGNSSCTCSGCKKPSTSTSKPKPSAGTTGQQARATAAGARGHVNPSRPAAPNSPGHSCVNNICPLQ